MIKKGKASSSSCENRSQDMMPSREKKSFCAARYNIYTFNVIVYRKRANERMDGLESMREEKRDVMG